MLYQALVPSVPPCSNVRFYISCYQDVGFRGSRRISDVSLILPWLSYIEQVGRLKSLLE